MTNINLKEISKYCYLLKEDAISEEIKQIINNYELIVTIFSNGKYILKFLDENDNTINLIIDADSIHITKVENDSFTSVTINNSLLLKQTNIEKRKKGIIITENRKIFERTKKYGNRLVLTDLIEDRYVFSDKKLDNLLAYSNSRNLSFEELFSRIKHTELCYTLSDYCDLYTNFSAHLESVFDWHKKSDSNSQPTKMFINGENLSSLFNIADGPDKIYRIYDLYRGIINERNEQDIISINTGQLSDNTFNYKRFIGITDKEEEIVGTKEKIISTEYVDYLADFFNEKFGYSGEITFERDTLLKAITHRMSAIEIIKKDIEARLGIPYSEFEMLDLDEQHKLIEKVTGKKKKPDCRMHIDGIPLDKKHILTREGAEKRLSKIVNDKPKSFFKKIIRKK